MIKNYIVSSAGRSGSHLLVGLIKSCGKNAVNTHDPFFEPWDAKFGPEATNGRETALILLQRKDLFASIMSMLVGTKTKQWSSYPNKVIPRFRVDRLDFVNQYCWQKNYLESCKSLKNYRQVKHLVFEDVVNDFDHVFRHLELTQLHLPELPPKAPYSYQDIIQNIDKCKIIFDELESNYKFTPLLKQNIPSRPEYKDTPSRPAFI